jgi:hypothetical protein
MPNRTAKFASAIFAGLLAGTPLSIISHSAAAAAGDECLSGPNDKTPGSGHWYYRIDRATKRHCWYQREDGGKPSQIAPPNSAASARPVAPKPATTAQRSVAEAHAELPGGQSRIEQPRRDRLVPAISADAAVGEINPDVKPPVAEGQQPNVASRWLGQSDTDPLNNPIFLTSPTPLAGPLPNGPVPISPVANKDDSDTNAGAAPSTQPLPSPAAGHFAAADLSSPTRSVQMLLAAIMGALALAGVMGRAIFKFVGPRSPAKLRGSNRRSAIWKSTDGGRTTSNAYPGADALPARPDFPRDLDQVDDPGDRIADLLRDFSRKGRKDRKARQPSPI